VADCALRESLSTKHPTSPFFVPYWASREAEEEGSAMTTARLIFLVYFDDFLLLWKQEGFQNLLELK
jgi:hypothetical protein